MVVGFHDQAIPNPLPELRLRGPELLAIAAQDQRILFLLLVYLLGAHEIEAGTPALNLESLS